ncbi:hypothetical protein [Pontibacter sp. SGAir0037]|uniref:hypothetical protein n=1 Tax=Pontibacter sp. SGAir0037 TaxID=2571030 RepID=UPI0010CD324E|nr:hypothetical protein [Pontibacter sp. SGAir0037]QCR24341.1 hypothetical protein C1N53_19565 [Pontibacter sp. SGAir0037]
MKILLKIFLFIGIILISKWNNDTVKEKEEALAKNNTSVPAAEPKEIDQVTEASFISTFN